MSYWLPSGQMKWLPARRTWCESCARRSYVRSAEHRGLPAWPARFAVIETDAAECHGSFDSEAELVTCLVFARRGRDQVEIVGDAEYFTPGDGREVDSPRAGGRTSVSSA